MLSLTSDHRTVFHGIPAGFKLLVLLVFSIALFVFPDLRVQAFALLLVFLAFICGGIGFLGEGINHLRRIWPVVAFICIWHGWSGEYAVGLALLFRLLAVLALANLVTMTTQLSQMMGVLNWLTIPIRRAGISTRPAEIAMAMMVRFIPVLSEKSEALRESWRARSPKRPGWRIVVPITLLAIDDADQVSEALRARGGVQKTQRTL